MMTMMDFIFKSQEELMARLEKLEVVERVRKRNPITFRLTKGFVEDRLSEVFE